MNDVFRIRLLVECSEDVLSAIISSSVTRGAILFFLDHDLRQCVSGQSHKHVRVPRPAHPSSAVVPELATELIPPHFRLRLLSTLK